MKEAERKPVKTSEERKLGKGGSSENQPKANGNLPEGSAVLLSRALDQGELRVTVRNHGRTSGSHLGRRVH